MKRCVLALLATVLAGGCGLASSNIASDAETESFSGCAQSSQCNFEMSAEQLPASCGTVQASLQDAWMSYELIRVPEWKKGEAIRPPKMGPNGIFIDNRNEAKTAIFEPGALYGVTNTKLELQVVDIFTVYISYSEGYQTAVVLKDVNSNTYYISIKTSYLLTQNPIGALGQLSNIWSNSVLIPYQWPDAVQAVRPGDGVQVNAAFFSYARALTTEMFGRVDANGRNIFDRMALLSAPKLVITGHSMAAAMAQIMASDIAGYAASTNNPLSVRAVLSGSPRAGNSGFADFLQDTLGVSVTRLTLFDQAGNTYVQNVDPISCYPTYEDGFVSVGSAVYVGNNNFYLSTSNSPYARCNVQVGLLSAFSNFQFLYGYLYQHLPPAYRDRYQAIQRQVNMGCP